jgi:hypothetical protein
MLRRHKTLAAATTIATASAIVFSSLTLASANAASEPGPRIQNFQLELNSVTSLPVTQIPMIAYGPITDYGTNVFLNPQDTRSVFRLQRGTINLDDIDYQHSSQHIDPATCLSMTTESGVYSINGGTGAYVGIRGNGTFRVQIIAIFTRDAHGVCSNSIPPQSIQLIDNSSGPVWLRR